MKMRPLCESERIDCDVGEKKAEAVGDGMHGVCLLINKSQGEQGEAALCEQVLQQVFLS